MEGSTSVCVIKLMNWFILVPKLQYLLQVGNVLQVVPTDLPPGNVLGAVPPPPPPPPLPPPPTTQQPQPHKSVVLQAGNVLQVWSSCQNSHSLMTFKHFRSNQRMLIFYPNPLKLDGISLDSYVNVSSYFMLCLFYEEHGWLLMNVWETDTCF